MGNTWESSNDCWHAFPSAIQFPGMSMDEAVRAFTERVYGEALTFA